MVEMSESRAGLEDKSDVKRQPMKELKKWSLACLYHPIAYQTAIPANASIMPFASWAEALIQVPARYAVDNAVSE